MIIYAVISGMVYGRYDYSHQEAYLIMRSEFGRRLEQLTKGAKLARVHCQCLPLKLLLLIH